jgi:hypothetical protein
MFRRLLVPGILALAPAAGCGLSECEALCNRNADCIEVELADFGSTWPEWTGYADRGAYEAACMAVFEDSREGGAGRSRLQRTCAAELDDGACMAGAGS